MSSEAKKTTDTKKISLGSLELSSSWKYKYDKDYSIDQAPTTSKKTLTASYSLPSGATITKAKVTMTKKTPGTGTSVFKINGNSKRDESSSKISVDISLKETSGSINLEFEYKANANKFYDTKIHSSTLTLSDITLEITYKIEQKVDEEIKKKSKKEKTFRLPPQCVAIIDQNNNNVYFFDGVTKIQHSLSMKIEEEPDENKEINKGKYVNNAKNEPDKVTLDVVMSDVYTGGGQLVEDSSMTDQQKSGISTAKGAAGGKSGVTWQRSTTMTRSEKAFYKLHEIKEARKKMSIVTPQFVYVDMILASITTTQDEEHTFGWVGQIVFQHAYEPKKKQENNWKPKTAGGTGIPTESGIVQTTLGENLG